MNERMHESAKRPFATPEEIAVRAGQQRMPRLRVPARPDVFAVRASRLRELAAGHSMRDFLLLMAELVNAQHEVLQDYPRVPLPDDHAFAAATQAGKPPLPATLWPRDPQWRLGLRGIIERLLPRLAPGPAAAAVHALRNLDDEALERQAERLLQGQLQGLDMAASPFVAAGLQVYWAHLVLAIREAGANGSKPGSLPFDPVDEATACPCCGSAPAASVVRIDAQSGAHRYLVCSLCPVQWHMVRIKCSRCRSTQGILYRSLQPATETPETPQTPQTPRRNGVEAETCDACGHYLKILRLERDPGAEPFADDLATLPLDLLVCEAGFERHGVNLMLLFADPEAI